MSKEPLGITLHQLKIFWTVAQATSFTKASKILGLAQPSLSQQISKLEDEVGSLLFKRGRSHMNLTEAGLYLQRRAEITLSGVEETMVGLRQFGTGQKGIISVGLLSSVARNLLPSAAGSLAKKIPDVELNILEVAPAEAIDLLYARQLSVAVLAEDSVAKSIVSFKKTNLFKDPYVLAVPKNISLVLVDVENGQQPNANTKKIIYEAFKTKGNIIVGLENLSVKDRLGIYDSENKKAILRFY